jgi:hypothetical protein
MGRDRRTRKVINIKRIGRREKDNKRRRRRKEKASKMSLCLTN